jgi:hypothetical protein
MVNWSSRTPNEAGWYWYRPYFGTKPALIRIHDHGAENLYVQGIGTDHVLERLEEFDRGEWAGPLEILAAPEQNEPDEEWTTLDAEEGPPDQHWERWEAALPGYPGYWWYRCHPDVAPIKVFVDCYDSVYVPCDGNEEVEMLMAEIPAGEWKMTQELYEAYWC